MKLCRVAPIKFAQVTSYCPRCRKHGNLTEGVFSVSNTMYCSKHYRILNARGRARSDGKGASSQDELEASLPVDLICPICTRTMCYHYSEIDWASVVSLQHWRDGTLSWLCHSCNSRHGSSILTDAEWIKQRSLITALEKFCFRCNKIKPLSEFYRATNEKLGVQGFCRSCTNEASRLNYIKKRKSLGVSNESSL
jgi:hypothetical protein